MHIPNYNILIYYNILRLSTIQSNNSNFLHSYPQLLNVSQLIQLKFSLENRYSFQLVRRVHRPYTHTHTHTFRKAHRSKRWESLGPKLLAADLTKRDPASYRACSYLCRPTAIHQIEFPRGELDGVERRRKRGRSDWMPAGNRLVGEEAPPSPPQTSVAYFRLILDRQLRSRDTEGRIHFGGNELSFYIPLC